MIYIENKFIGIKNYENIILLENNMVEIKMPNNTLTITGSNLEVRYYSDVEIIIHGCINNINFI